MAEAWACDTPACKGNDRVAVKPCPLEKVRLPLNRWTAMSTIDRPKPLPAAEDVPR